MENCRRSHRFVSKQTTLLNVLQSGAPRSFPPTDRPTLQEFTIYGISFSCWDLGGHEAVRHLWEDYTADISGVLFLIDSADVERIEEAGFELDHLIHEGKLDSVPIAVLFNKTDLEQSLESRQVCQRIEYNKLVQSHNGKMECFRISVLEQTGYQEAFRWISNLI